MAGRHAPPRPESANLPGPGQYNLPASVLSGTRAPFATGSGMVRGFGFGTGKRMQFMKDKTPAPGSYMIPTTLRTDRGITIAPKYGGMKFQDASSGFMGQAYTQFG